MEKELFLLLTALACCLVTVLCRVFRYTLGKQSLINLIKITQLLGFLGVFVCLGARDVAWVDQFMAFIGLLPWLWIDKLGIHFYQLWRQVPDRIANIRNHSSYDLDWDECGKPEVSVEWLIWTALYSLVIIFYFVCLFADFKMFPVDLCVVEAMTLPYDWSFSYFSFRSLFASLLLGVAYTFFIGVACFIMWMGAGLLFILKKAFMLWWRD